MTRIQGYALVWNDTARVEGLIERCARNAVSLPPNIALLANSHDPDSLAYASTADRTLSLWADDHGLAFRADLDDSTPAQALALSICSGSTAEVSVNFTHMRRDAAGLIQWAQIDHIAIVSSGAYHQTWAWCPELARKRMTAKQRRSAELYAEGLKGQIKNARPGAMGGLVMARAAGIRQPPRQPKVQVPASVIAMMAQPWWPR